MNTLYILYVKDACIYNSPDQPRILWGCWVSYIYPSVQVCISYNFWMMILVCALSFITSLKVWMCDEGRSSLQVSGTLELPFEHRWAVADDSLWSGPDSLNCIVPLTCPFQPPVFSPSVNKLVVRILLSVSSNNSSDGPRILMYWGGCLQMQISHVLLQRSENLHF